MVQPVQNFGMPNLNFTLDAINSEKHYLRIKWGHATEEKKWMILQKSGLFAKIISLPKFIPLRH